MTAPRIAGLLVLLVASAGVARADDVITGAHPRNWTAPSLEDAFTILPCGAFRKDADGRWILAGTLTTDSGDKFTDAVADADQTKALDSRCGDS